jgi:asparagine synthase (glutamine-hydrolysing)
MCGITGIVDLVGERPLDMQLLRRMTGALTHRGPDGDGFHLEPGVGFGHRRLSIIDLEGGKQPLYNEDYSVVVTFNGEIFNFLEIEAELVARGHVFRTRCDTEVIVHGWEEWGERCIERFNGMFAFAIWDQKRRTLFLARDRLGVKPLHYAMLPDGQLVFASELKALLAHPGVPRRIDPVAVEDYFAFSYIPDPKTIYRDVRKLEPGATWTLRRGEPPRPPVRYWDVPLMGERHIPGSQQDWEAELRARLQAAVRKRLISDVPLGAFLSGGIDSSAVVAMMSEIGVKRILTCSIGFREPQYDESAFARRVAQAKGTDHRSEIVEACDFGVLDRLGGIYDEPFADSSAIPTYLVCRLARRHVTVALSGDGGDENFIGYRRYRLFAAEEAVRRRLPAFVRHAVFGPLGRLYPKLDWAPRVFRAKTTFEALARTTVEGYLHGVSICSEELRECLFADGFRSQLQGYGARQVFEGHIRGKHFADPLALVQYLDFKTYLPGDILTKVDRASMANSLEVRTPFLDYELVEWVSKLPSRVKLSRGEGKLVLKNALRPLLPESVLLRRKMGFAVPMDLWFRGSLREHGAKIVAGERLAGCGIFNPQTLGRLVDEHSSQHRDHSAVLWALLMFDQFLRIESGESSPLSPERPSPGNHEVGTRDAVISRIAVS